MALLLITIVGGLRHIDAVRKKANQRMYILRKLHGFNADQSLMRLFYSSLIDSVVTFSFVCWFGLLSMQGILKICSKIAGISLTSHPLCSELIPSGRRFKNSKCRANRLKKIICPCCHRVFKRLSVVLNTIYLFMFFYCIVCNVV